MNRIREIREGLGVSAEDLAEKLQTTATTIRRLETGKRQLTELWMRRIATALNVHPAELLDAAVLAEVCDDVCAESLPDLAHVISALKARKMGFYRVLTDVVSDAGSPQGSLILADHDPESIGRAKTGDLVIAQVEHDTHSALVLRVLVQPDLLVTNRSVSNVAMKMRGDGLRTRLVAVVAPRDDVSGQRV